ncbi:MAG: BON domain-containing protein [Acidobacteria bacterium]|nr:BON domain-containing protein [Acidobacteriota bacterium]MBV9477978.1 BON domain-containing protein [Acidobacteriota bacterium]
MPNRYDRDRDERDRGEFSGGPFGTRSNFGGDYARDGGWSGGGSRDDYGREGGWSGGGSRDDYARDEFTRGDGGGRGNYDTRGDSGREDFGRNDYDRDAFFSRGGTSRNDTNRDDYNRGGDSGRGNANDRWGGTGASGDWAGSGSRGRGVASVGYGPAQTRSTYGDDSLGGSAAAYGGDRGDRGAARESYRGRGPKNWRRSDERIREIVNELLTEHDGIDATDIEVSVENGEVTLTGHVGSRWEKRLADDIAHSCGGVHDVHNRLKVSDRETQVGKASE